MADGPLERFVESMTVGEFCARLECSVTDLLERAPKASATPPAEATPPVSVDAVADLLALPMKEARAKFERRYVEAAIEACSGNRALASIRSGMSRSALYDILGRPSGK